MRITGWQNIATEIHKLPTRLHVRDRIAMQFPESVETPTDQKFVYGYWVPENERQRLVGVTWIDNTHHWSFVMMPRTAFDLGMDCALHCHNDRIMILPASSISKIIDRKTNVSPDVLERMQHERELFIRSRIVQQADREKARRDQRHQRAIDLAIFKMAAQRLENREREAQAALDPERLKEALEHFEQVWAREWITIRQQGEFAATVEEMAAQLNAESVIKFNPPKSGLGLFWDYLDEIENV